MSYVKIIEMNTENEILTFSLLQLAYPSSGNRYFIDEAVLKVQ